MPYPTPEHRLCMMMCVHDEADTILDHLRYHQFLGVSRAYVFLDDCRDGTAEILSRLPWVAAIDRPRDANAGQLTTYQNLCARQALELARRDGFGWLLHIDPDEYAWGDNASSGNPASDGSLPGLIRRAQPGTELIRLRTKEAIPLREEQGPLWRREYFQVHPHVFERDMLDPISGQVRRLAKWIGHNLGKSIVRTTVDAEPVSAHTWQRRGGDDERRGLLTEWLGFHYHFVVGDASSWLAKYRKLAWEPSSWTPDNPVPFPKQAWKEASTVLGDAEAVEYYNRWIAVSRDQVDTLVREGKACRERMVWAAMDAVNAGMPA